MENIKKFLKNIEPRKYQIDIFLTCRDKNCLVVLPTGMGKTLIALMLSIERLEKHPDSKILFMAPTRPLAEQHLNYFKKHLPELFATLELFTGKTPASKRKKLWQNSEIIFSTPQCISNDLKNNLYDLKEVSLLIEDECHRCIKNYAYTYVASEYLKQAENLRILGLTASPGHEKEKIKKICKNLNIEAVESRTRESEDVKEYIQKLNFETVKVDFPQELMQIKEFLQVIFKKKIEELKNRKLLFMPPTKKNLLELQHRIMRVISSGNKNFNILSGASACAQTIKLQHTLELLETQTLSSLLSYFQDLFDQAKQNKSRAVINLVKQKEFNLAYTKLVDLISKKQEHPKLFKIKEIIEKEFLDNPKGKIIVFAQYRDTVTKICKELNSIKGVNARVFVGQAKKKNIEGKETTGLSQKEQQEMIREFSAGEINCLCSTSIHPDEYIILKKDDKVMIKKIWEFVESFIKSNGDITASKKISGWEALTSDGEKLLFRPITRVHRHLTQNEVVKVKLSSGFDCSITENHSLFSFNEKGKFIPSIPKQNKFVALSLNCPNIKKSEKIDVIKEIYENCHKRELENLFGSLQGLSQAKMRILKTDFSILSKLREKELSITELSNLTKRDYSTVLDCLNRTKKQGFIIQKRTNKNLSILTKLGREYLDFLEWFFKNVKYRKGKYRFRLDNTLKNLKKFNEFFTQSLNVNYGKTKFPRFLELNKSLARFLGFYVSEGSARKTEYTSDVFLAARDKKMQQMMKESVRNGLKLKTRTNWRGIAIDSQIAYYLIKDIFKAGIGAYNKEIPEIIFTAPSNIKWEFLRAYFLGDGYSDKERIVFTTVSRKLVTGFVLLLRMLGIEKITIHRQNNIYRLVIHQSLPFEKIK